MATIKSYTDLEQSKKLAEILPIESADNYYSWHDERYYVVNKDCPYPYSLKEKIPCWSLAVLMQLLPSEFTEKGKYSETTYNIRIRKYALTDDVDLYQIAYGNYKFYEDGSSSWKDMINTGEKENLIDAAFDMICWLKENNKL
jgi:hypothetical protein